MATKKKKKKDDNKGVLIFGGLAAVGLLLASNSAKPASTPDYNLQTGAIGRNFNISDVTKSDTATNLNFTEQFNPPEEIYIAASKLVSAFLDSLMDVVKKNGWTLKINSWYRHPYINKLVGGVNGSWHIAGVAVDLQLYNENGKLINWTLTNWLLNKLNGDWNELILEGGILQPSSNENYQQLKPNTVHIAYVPGDNIGEIVTMENSGVQTVHDMAWLKKYFD